MPPPISGSLISSYNVSRSKKPHLLREYLDQFSQSQDEIDQAEAAAHLIPDSLEEFFKSYIRTEKGDKYTFEGREFLQEIMADDNDIIYLTKGRQVGASTLMAGTIIRNAMKYPRTMHIYIADTYQHARGFARQRLRPILRDTGFVANIPPRDDLVMELTLPNRSTILLMGAYNEYRQARSYSADFVYLDEAQLTELHTLANLLEGMSQSKYNRTIIAGTGAPEGSAWEEKWLTTTMCEFEDGKWVKHNPTSSVSGYHITQYMMPNITPEMIEEKRKRYTAAEFIMEVEGGFATGAEIPLTAAEARKIYYTCEVMPLPTTQKPQNHIRIMSLDLAHGGEAFTVATIISYSQAEDFSDVLYVEKYDDSRNTPLMEKLDKLASDWLPDVIISDAGGNIDLLQRLRDKYTVHAYKSGGQLEHIKYTHADEDTYPISKSYFMERTIDRILRRQIRIPDHTHTTPWTIEHLTAERAELIEPKGGATYTRYEKQSNRQDDFLQSLMFAECHIYSITDENNPNNRQVSIIGSFGPKW